MSVFCTPLPLAILVTWVPTPPPFPPLLINPCKPFTAVFGCWFPWGCCLHAEFNKLLFFLLAVAVSHILNKARALDALLTRGRVSHSCWWCWFASWDVPKGQSCTAAASVSVLCPAFPAMGWRSHTTNKLQKYFINYITFFCLICSLVVIVLFNLLIFHKLIPLNTSSTI